MPKVWQLFKKFQIALFFFCIAAMIAVIQFSSSHLLASDDGYRHIITARAITRDGWMIAHAMPWLPLSFFAQHPSDPWFLFHILLVPFTALPLVVGLKGWVVLSVLALAGAFYALVRTLRVRLPALWTLLFLFGSAAFFFRIQIGRAFTVTLIFFLLALAAMVRAYTETESLSRQRLGLIACGALVALAILVHSVAVIIPAFLLLYLSLRALMQKLGRGNLIMGMLVIVCASAIGLFARPYPIGFTFYDLPFLFGIPISANLRSSLRFGSEVYGMDPISFLGDSFLILGLYLPALAWGIFSWIEKRRSTSPGPSLLRRGSGVLPLTKGELEEVVGRFFLIASAGTFILSFFTMRFFDFFVPLAVMATAVVAKPILQRTVLRADGGLSSPVVALFASFRGWERILLWFLGLAVFFFFASRIAHTIEVGRGATDPEAAFGETVRAIEDDLARKQSPLLGESLSQGEGEGEGGSRQLADPHPNPLPARQGEGVISRPLIFNTQWDIFPMLFYLYPDAAYVAGMDPMLLYAADKEKFWLWHHLSNDTLTTCGEEQCTQYRDPVSVIREDFRARYVLVDRKRNPKLEQYLKAKKEAFALLGETERAAAFAVR